MVAKQVRGQINHLNGEIYVINLHCQHPDHSLIGRSGAGIVERMSYRNQWPTNRLLSTAARLVEHAWNESLASLGITHAGVMVLDVLQAEGVGRSA